MNYSPFFSVFLGIFPFIWTCNNFFSPVSRSDELAYEQQSQQNGQIEVISSELAADGLDLKALPALVQSSKDATALEAKLNEPNGINNLDLNNDGVVDYLKVEEFGEELDRRGFSITTEIAEGEVQEVATVELVKKDDKVEVATHGNEQIYGRGYGYSGLYSLSSVLMWSYILSPHTFYSSPYGYNRYPNSYGTPRTTTSADYKSRASRFEKTTHTAPSSTMKSPNVNRSASGIRRGLRQPTTSQKSFQTRTRSKVGSGGFGNFSRKSSSSQQGFFGSGRSIRSFSSSRRSGGFGGFGK